MTNELEFAQYKAQIVKNLVEQWNLPHKTIIDLYAGDGAMAFYMQEIMFYTRIMGYENNGESYMIAKELFPHIPFFYSTTLDNVHFGQVDIALVSLALHHIPPALRIDFLHTVHNHLNVKNMIILEFNPYRPDIQWLKITDPLESDAHFITHHQLVQQAQKTGWTVCNISWHLPPFFTTIPTWLKNAPIGALYSIILQKK